MDPGDALLLHVDPDAFPVGYADLQTPLWRTSHALGSGRAVFFRGRYLKGVGLTPLAKGWTSADHYHNSGHLFPSAAVRERLVSLLLRRLGYADTIVPCEGVAFKRSPRAVRLKTALSYHPGEVLPCDRGVQAITVKPSGFTRLSNFQWLLDTCTNGPTLGAFFRDLSAALARTPPSRAPTPREVVAILSALERSMERALERTSDFFDAGVNWGSYGNNFALDGRFLDLELPAVLGGPQLAVLHHRGPSPPAVLHGSELLDVAVQYRAFARALVTRCDFVARLDRRPWVRETAASVRAFDRRVYARLFAHDVLCARLHSLYERHLELPRRVSRLLRTYLLANHRWNFASASVTELQTILQDPTWAWREQGVVAYPIELGRAPALLRSGAVSPRWREPHVAEAFARAVRAMDAERSPAALADRLAHLEASAFRDLPRSRVGGRKRGAP